DVVLIQLDQLALLPNAYVTPCEDPPVACELFLEVFLAAVGVFSNSSDLRELIFLAAVLRHAGQEAIGVGIGEGFGNLGHADGVTADNNRPSAAASICPSLACSRTTASAASGPVISV